MRRVTIETRSRRRPRGYGSWLFAGPRGQQVVYSGWYADAPSYLAANYGRGHWYLVA